MSRSPIYNNKNMQFFYSITLKITLYLNLFKNMTTYFRVQDKIYNVRKTVHNVFNFDEYTIVTEHSGFTPYTLKLTFFYLNL